MGSQLERVRQSSIALEGSSPPGKPNSLTNPERGVTRLPFFYWGLWAVFIGLVMYFAAIFLSIVRLVLFHPNLFVGLITKLLWISGFPTTIGIILITVDLAAYFPRKRRGIHRVSPPLSGEPLITAVLAFHTTMS